MGSASVQRDLSAISRLWKELMKRRKRENMPSNIRPERRCSFCDTDIPADHEVVGFGAKARPEVDIERYRGTGIEITVQSLNRRVMAIVTGRDSPAARAGHDLYFTACSESCAKAMKAALEEDLKRGGSMLE